MFRLHSFSLLSALASFLTPCILAQQYEGIETGLSPKSATSSELANFNIVTPSGQNATLLNYFSFFNNTRPDPQSLRRLVIMIHGNNRNAWDYFGYVRDALINARTILPEVTEQNVALFVPWWANIDDVPNEAGPALVWKGTGWSSGDNNVFPEDGERVSSFDCLDQILLHFDDKSLYPNLQHIVVAGHSRGGEMTQRYAAIGKKFPLTSTLSYWLANPASFLWFNPTRPIPTDNCPKYNEWNLGLDGYINDYQNAFVNEKGAAGVWEQYNSQYIGVARGLNDFGNTFADCEALTQGENRGERFFNFIQSFPPSTSFATLDYVPNVGHNARNMIGDESGLYRLFIDHWNGESHRHADFGPRQVEGDSPHPIDD